MDHRIYVRNLAPSVKLEMLEDMFGSVGDVEVSEFGLANALSTLRTAYVNMRTEQGMNDCIERFNGQKCEGLSLIVTRDEPHQPDPRFKLRKRGRV